MRGIRRAILAGLTCAALALAGCRPIVDDPSEHLDVYATFFPIYALTEAVTHDVPDLTLHCLVQPQDGCLRDYQISDWDVSLLTRSADAVIAGGRGLESFESTLYALGKDGPVVSAVLYNLDLYNRSTSHAAQKEDSHLEGPNPHLYMSVDGARRMLEGIAAHMETLDPRYAALYAQNLQNADGELEALRAEIDAAAADITERRVVLMNEGLIYTARDFGLEVVAWIDRESGEALFTDALEECLDTVRKSGAKVALIERQAPTSLVRALEDAGIAVARIDIFSTHREGEGFEAYLQVQRSNTEAVKRAFARAENREVIK